MALTQSQIQRSHGIGTDIENPPPPRVKQGRPSEFMPEKTEQAAALAWHGATISEIAQYFGVSVPTIYAWGQLWPPFLNAIKQDRENADNRIKQTLYEKAATGDNTAMIFWLKNRDPMNWRDQREVKLEGAIDVTTNTNTRELALAVLAAIQDGVRTPLVIDGEVENVET